MEIYAVIHRYDNGESYEDYREYEDTRLYSTRKKAQDFFWASVVADYEGKYFLIEWELDTQRKKILEESAWISCTPYYNDEWEGDDGPEYEPEYDLENDPDLMKSYKDYWRYEDTFGCGDDIPEEDDKAWLEYVITPGTNYQTFKEVENELAKRKEAMMINSNPHSILILDELVELLGIKFEDEE